MKAHANWLSAASLFPGGDATLASEWVCSTQARLFRGVDRGMDDEGATLTPCGVSSELSPLV